MAASTCARMLAPSVVRFAAERQGCVQMFLVVSLFMAALYFSSADLCFAGSFSSQMFSSKSFPLKKASAIFTWHLIAAAASLPSSLPTASAHLSWLPSAGTKPASSPL